MDFEKGYIAESGILCPVCKSEDISGASIDREEDYYVQEMGCNNCGAAWSDILHLVGISELRHAKLVVEVKLGDTSYGKKVLDCAPVTMLGDLIFVDTKGAPDSDQLYCEDQFGYRYKWYQAEAEDYATFTKI